MTRFDELNVELSLGKIKEWKMFWMHKGNESPLSHLVRHTDALPKKLTDILVLAESKPIS